MGAVESSSEIKMSMRGCMLMGNLMELECISGTMGVSTMETF